MNLWIERYVNTVMAEDSLFFATNLKKLTPTKASWSISMNRSKIPYYMGLLTLLCVYCFLVEILWFCPKYFSLFHRNLFQIITTLTSWTTKNLYMDLGRFLSYPFFLYALQFYVQKLYKQKRRYMTDKTKYSNISVSNET